MMNFAAAGEIGALVVPCEIDKTPSSHRLLRVTRLAANVAATLIDARESNLDVPVKLFPFASHQRYPHP